MYRSAIITTLFNHRDSPYFQNNWQHFIYSLRQRNLLQHLFVCEVLPDNMPSMIDGSNFNHWIVRNNSYLWHKEAALNYLLNNIPSSYDGIIAMDNDIICNNNNWYSDTCNLLSTYVAVQPYSTIEYLLLDTLGIDLIDHGLVDICSTSSTMTGGNPGLLVAYRREYLKHTGGFFDRCFVGGGDVINIAPFYIGTHGIPFNMFNAVTKDTIPDMIDYISKGYQFLKQQTSPYIAFDANHQITHLFHGYWNDRNYTDRYSLLTNLSNASFEQNADHLYDTIEESTQQQLKQFFIDRLSISKQDKPIIVLSSKYTPDSDTVLWTSPNTTIYCYNIKKIRLALHRQQDIGNIEIFINNQLINISQLVESGEQTLSYNDPYCISIECSKSMDAPLDRRELGLFISSINIVSNVSDNTEETWTTYSLTDIL